jgi:hypothetical protein
VSTDPREASATSADAPALSSAADAAPVLTPSQVARLAALGREGCPTRVEWTGTRVGDVDVASTRRQDGRGRAH